MTLFFHFDFRCGFLFFPFGFQLMFLFFWFDLQYIRFSFFFGVVSNFFFSSVPSNYKHQRKKKRKSKTESKKTKTNYIKKTERKLVAIYPHQLRPEAAENLITRMGSQRSKSQWSTIQTVGIVFCFFCEDPASHCWSLPHPGAWCSSTTPRSPGPPSNLYLRRAFWPNPPVVKAPMSWLQPPSAKRRCPL